MTFGHQRRKLCDQGYLETTLNEIVTTTIFNRVRCGANPADELREIQYHVCDIWKARLPGSHFSVPIKRIAHIALRVLADTYPERIPAFMASLSPRLRSQLRGKVHQECERAQKMWGDPSARRRMAGAA